MVKNYIKLAFRNLVKHKVTSSINLLGLTLGIASCLLLVLYVLHEVSYEKWNPNADNVYRVSRIFKTSDGVKSMETGTVAPPFGHYFPSEFDEIEKLTRLFGHTLSVKYSDKLFNEKNVFFADENFFEIFPAKIITGNTELQNPYSAMITEEVAVKYFGTENPVNKVIRINNQADIKVTGVFKAFPANSHMHPEVLIAFNTLNEPALYGEEQLRTNWGNNSFFTYLQLPGGYDPALLEKRFPAFLDKYLIREYGGSKPSDFTSLYLRKLSDIHLHSHTDVEAEPNGDITRVYLFSVIALFMMLIACINYMNLSTASATLRAKEVGLRKTIGAGKRELVCQFLSESLLMCLLATGIAICVSWLALPLFNSISGLSLTLQPLWQTKVLLILVTTPLLVAFISGIYPALYISSFQPVKTLKGFFKTDRGGIAFRKALVVSQFAIGIVLIIATLIVTQQLNYLHNKTLGYNKDQIVTLPYSSIMDGQFEAFKNELKQNTDIKDISRASRIPTGRLLDNMGASVPMGDSAKPVSSDIRYIYCDYDFINTFDIGMAAGRFFSKANGTDSANFVINQATVKAVGWNGDEDAIGKYFVYGGQRGQIVGVTKDFHFESMHQSISPMVFMLESDYRQLAIKLQSGNIAASVHNVEAVWQKHFPDAPFDFRFLDERFDRLYESEQKAAGIFTSFSIIAICIACLGLFGLSTFSVSQRIKEVGVRKVLGASINGLIVLLAKDFLKLVLIAAVVAFPLAWYMADKWLTGFAYRISVQWWVFIVAGFITLAIAFLTVSFQAVKAAMANPVKSLKSE